MPNAWESAPLASSGWQSAPMANPIDNRGFGEKLNSNIAGIPRALGLFARDGIETIGDGLDTLSSPIRGALNMVLPDSAQIKPRSVLSDILNLPKPATPLERVVSDATKTMGSMALPFGIASRAAETAPLVRMVQPGTGGTVIGNALTSAGNYMGDFGNGIAKTFAMNPGSQVLSAGAAGGAGGYTRETGGDPTSQFLASVAAGVAAPAAMSLGRNALSATSNLVNNLTSKPGALNAQLDLTINNALRPNGLTLGDLPADMQTSIRQDVGAALKNDGVMSPDALRRLADYKLTGLTPTAATLTLDPAMVSQQKNLAKLGINSKDAAAQQLGRVENANNAQLISGLNDLGAGQAVGKFGVGQRMVNSLSSYADATKGQITNLYNAAKDSQGRSLPLDPSVFSQSANNLLDYNMKGAFVPGEIRNMMNDFASGKVPLNIHSAEQFKTILGNAQRGATDGNVRAAVGHIRQALDNTPLIGDTTINGGLQLKPVGGLGSANGSVGQDAIDAFNAARSAHRNFMGQVEGNPALASAMDGAAPDTFFAKHVLNGPVRDLEAMLPIVGANNIKADLVAHLKGVAINGANDEVGNFSQSAYNKALQAVGDQKLGMIFNPAEVSQLKALGRVASYEQFQPKGSAVNNSNTAGSAIATILDKIGNSPLLSKIPFGNQLAAPAQNIAIGIKSKNALNIPNALAGIPIKNPSQPNALMLSPAAFMTNDDRKKNSLLPP